MLVSNRKLLTLWQPWYNSGLTARSCFCDSYKWCVCARVGIWAAILNTTRDDSKPHLPHNSKAASTQYSSGATAAAAVQHQRTSQRSCTQERLYSPLFNLRHPPDFRGSLVLVYTCTKLTLAKVRPSTLHYSSNHYSSALGMAYCCEMLRYSVPWV